MNISRKGPDSKWYFYIYVDDGDLDPSDLENSNKRINRRLIDACYEMDEFLNTAKKLAGVYMDNIAAIDAAIENNMKTSRMLMDIKNDLKKKWAWCDE